MKLKIQALALTLASALISVNAVADSTYGYDSTGIGQVSATAHAKITVKVPKLVLLRVGTAGSSIDEVVLQGVPTINSITGAITAGNSQAATWDGAIPTFSDVSNTINAYLWTNSSGGADLTCTSTAFDASSNITSADIAVSLTAGTLAHPGSDTICASTSKTHIARHTLGTATWKYTITAATLAQAPAGTYSQDITYTATTL